MVIFNGGYKLSVVENSDEQKEVFKDDIIKTKCKRLVVQRSEKKMTLDCNHFICIHYTLKIPYSLKFFTGSILVSQLPLRKKDELNHP